MLTMLIYVALLTLSVLASVSLADNTGTDPAGHEWQKPGPFDSRSPCPGLNALANHGFLPRDGKNIDYAKLKSAAEGGYNYTEDVYQIFYNLTTQFYTNISTTNDPTTFNLEDLARHNTIEQDGSLSRNDIYFGDDLHFSPAIWEPTAKILGLNDITADNAYVSNQTAADAYLARQKAAQAANPQFTIDFLQRNGTRGTTALYLATFWDFEAKAARKSWLKTFFTEERIPYVEGYTTQVKKNTDFIHEFVVSIYDIVGYD